MRGRSGVLWTRATAVDAAPLVLLALAPLAFAALGEGYWLTLATRVTILGLAAVGLDLLIGRAGLVSFGHAAFFGLGAYAVAIPALHAAEFRPLFGWAGSEEALATWPLAVLVGALVALPIGALALRTRGVNFIMITLAFAQMAFFVVTGLEAYGGDDGLIMYGRNKIAGVGIDDPLAYHYLCLALLCLVLLGLRRLMRSSFGLALEATRMSERRAAALGLPVFRLRLAAFVLAAAVAALAGAMFANAERFVSPDLLGWRLSGEFMVMVILGGTGTLTGPLLGAVALVGMETVFAAWTEHWLVPLGAVLVLAVLVSRAGLRGRLAGGAA